MDSTNNVDEHIHIQRQAQPLTQGDQTRRGVASQRGEDAQMAHHDVIQEQKKEEKK